MNQAKMILEHIQELQSYLISCNNEEGKLISLCRPSLIGKKQTLNNEVYFWALEDLKNFIQEEVKSCENSNRGVHVRHVSL